MGEVEGRVLALLDSKYEIPFFQIVRSNPDGKNGREQYLAGSFSGALSS